MKQKILVTGANGQLGSELRMLSHSHPNVDFVFLSKEDLAIDNADSVNRLFDIHQPAYCVNCAAYTAVDKAESEPEQAFRVNAEATRILAESCRVHNTRFIHISTDYVFDGMASTPYKETDPTKPQGVYGESKWQGEELALQSNADTIVIRTSWVYSSFGKNFVKTMLRLMNEKTEIGVVNDQVGSPTYAADLAEAILSIIFNANWQPGIYHYSNDGVISWYEFALAIKELTHSACKVNPIPTSAYPLPAKRPAYSVLDTTKIKSRFNIAEKPWRQSLQQCLQVINNNTK